LELQWLQIGRSALFLKHKNQLCLKTVFWIVLLFYHLAVSGWNNVFWLIPWIYFFVFRSAENEGKVANVRRENKLYSYQEQMAEIELKKVCILLFRLKVAFKL
jgi:hypothetical protein